jgi:hypothetical protein
MDQTRARTPPSDRWSAVAIAVGTLIGPVAEALYLVSGSQLGRVKVIVVSSVSRVARIPPCCAVVAGQVRPFGCWAESVLTCVGFATVGHYRPADHVGSVNDGVGPVPVVVGVVVARGVPVRGRPGSEPYRRPGLRRRPHQRVRSRC